jgi:hypothetical protein
MFVCSGYITYILFDLKYMPGNVACEPGDYFCVPGMPELGKKPRPQANVA